MTILEKQLLGKILPKKDINLEYVEGDRILAVEELKNIIGVAVSVKSQKLIISIEHALRIANGEYQELPCYE